MKAIKGGTRILYAVLFFGISNSCQQSKILSGSIDDDLLYLDTSLGASLLSRASSIEDFLPLVIRFETQKNLAYCGPASCVMVLNALELEAPKSAFHGSFNFFTQENIFTKEVERIISASTVQRQGMTLDELAGVLAANGAQAEALHAKETNLFYFRKKANTWIREKQAFVIVNYLRSSIGQEKGGHISPIVAYDAPSDCYLILDVSRYKYSPVWVGAKKLFSAMNTMDFISGKSRGFVLVSR